MSGYKRWHQKKKETPKYLELSMLTKSLLSTLEAPKTQCPQLEPGLAPWENA